MKWFSMVCLETSLFVIGKVYLKYLIHIIIQMLLKILFDVIILNWLSARKYLNQTDNETKLFNHLDDNTLKSQMNCSVTRRFNYIFFNQFYLVVGWALINHKIFKLYSWRNLVAFFFDWNNKEHKLYITMILCICS